MKLFQATTVAALLVSSLSAHAGGAVIDLTVSGEIQPGVYGEVHLGNSAPPPVVYARPVVIVQQHEDDRPLYLHVPPGHAHNWKRHCGEYNACNRPVYFVRSSEYDSGDGDRRGRGRDRGDDRRDEDGRGGDERGNGQGRGRGHGHGHGHDRD